MKLKDDDGLEHEVKKLNTMPSRAVFIHSNSKRIMNIFTHAFDGFYNNSVYYTDTDSFYIENKHVGKLDKFGLVGNILLQGKKRLQRWWIFQWTVSSTKNKILFDNNEIWCY